MNFNLNNLLQAFRPLESPMRPAGKRSSGSSSQLGYLRGQAIVEQTIQPGKSGRVRFKGSWWSARCDQAVTIVPGEVVDVIGVQTITLLVEPAFLLTASKIGLAKAQMICEQRGWLDRDPDWLMHSDAGSIVVSPSGEGDQPGAIPSEVWRRFIHGQPIYISSFKACCEKLGLNWKETVGYGESKPDILPLAPENAVQAEQLSDLDSQVDREFVGREQAIADLDRLVQQDARTILLLGEGGMGKTALAQHYFSHAGCDRVLECWMAKDTQNMISAESVVQGWLQQYFNEPPAREFQAALEQLRQHLRDSTLNEQPARLGVLIDNLEPILDREGQVIEARRDYVALLEMLSDPQLSSITLITSREPLREATVMARAYPLTGLDRVAWQQFFTLQHLQLDAQALDQMHRAYSGNAKAMTILSSAIRVDFQGDMAAFWKDHATNLLREADLAKLVRSHFDRLQQIYPEAYRLLCRLGCYRYQDVATLPLEGLFCQLWDVPPTQHRSVVRFLRDLSLIEPSGDRYRLHPMIQAQAVALLKSSPDWELANRRAADFWTTSVRSIGGIEEALMALEAYYHTIQLEDYEAAAAVILQGRDNLWQKAEPLGISLYRLGLLRRMIVVINRVINRIQASDAVSRLHNILGDVYWLKGELHQAIACHQTAQEVARSVNNQDLELRSLYNTGLCKIGLWELEAAVDIFDQVNAAAEQTRQHIYAVGSWFCLAFLYSHLDRHPEALTLIRKVSEEYAVLSGSSWSRGYSLLFLGLTLQNLSDQERATKLHRMARDYAEQSGYIQLKAAALNGLGAVCRDQQDFKGAIAHHLAAQRLADRLEAKGDLAEVYYQLGVTYQQMQETAQSQANFQKAIALFQQMKAPKQVERVQRAIEGL